jgi:hypothetical protein
MYLEISIPSPQNFTIQNILENNLYQNFQTDMFEIDFNSIQES